MDNDDAPTHAHPTPQQATANHTMRLIEQVSHHMFLARPSDLIEHQHTVDSAFYEDGDVETKQLTNTYCRDFA